MANLEVDFGGGSGTTGDIGVAFMELHTDAVLAPGGLYFRLVVDGDSEHQRSYSSGVLTNLEKDGPSKITLTSPEEIQVHNGGFVADGIALRGNLAPASDSEVMFYLNFPDAEFENEGRYTVTGFNIEFG